MLVFSYVTVTHTSTTNWFIDTKCWIISDTFCKNDFFLSWVFQVLFFHCDIYINHTFYTLHFVKNQNLQGCHCYASRLCCAVFLWYDIHFTPTWGKSTSVHFSLWQVTCLGKRVTCNCSQRNATHRIGVVQNLLSKKMISNGICYRLNV